MSTRKKQGTERRVIMTRKVAKAWLSARSRPLYTFRVYYQGPKSHRMLDTLKSFRDSKLKLASVDPIPDLGVKGSFDNMTVWSKNREALITLRQWFETLNYETSGIW